MSGLIHYVVLHTHGGILTVADVEAVRSQLADIHCGEHVKVRIAGRLDHFHPGVGELLGRWMSPAGDVEMLGGGWTRRALFESMCAGARLERAAATA